MEKNLLKRAAWIEVDLQALRENFVNIKALLPAETQIVAVVKANAYGHGAVPVAQCLLAEGASRQAEGRTALCQLVLDSGMGRIGLRPTAEARQEALSIAKLPYLQLEGMFSHFAAADELDKTHARQQLTVYQQFAADLAAAGLELPLLNIANSAAIMPGAHLDMVRAGIIIYGYYPSAEVERERLRLRPALSIKACLTCLKWVPADTPISYGCTFVTERPSLIGTVPVGYADGWRRSLSNRGQVLVAGQRAPIVGRVCMDQFMIDLDWSALTRRKSPPGWIP